MASNAVKRVLRKNYEGACDAYLVELLNAWELDSHYGYWIGDEIGGTYAYGDWIFINIDDIIYCVENDVTEDEYAKYQDYNVAASEFGFDLINLKAWHMNAPRIPKETFDKLRKMKQDLDEEIKKEKERINKENQNQNQNPF